MSVLAHLSAEVVRTDIFLYALESSFRMSEKSENKRLARWYFGGLGSAGAACCTHPLDLLKVHLQTQQEGKIGIVKQTLSIVR